MELPLLRFLFYDVYLELKMDLCLVFKVVLRWGIQRGCSVIPKSENVDRIKENITVEHFKLSKDDMEEIKKLEAGFRMNDPAVFCPMFFNTHCPLWD